MKIKPVSVNEVAYAAHRLAVKFMTWNEPIPSFNTRFPNVLESCLEIPFRTYERKHFYQGITGKGAILFYLMVKNHPFQNGNKRTAVMTLFFFLYKNGKWLDIGNEELYRVAVGVAKSKGSKSKDRIMLWLEKTFAQHLISYPRKRSIKRKK
jgi:death-on-curing protein